MSLANDERCSGWQMRLLRFLLSLLTVFGLQWTAAGQDESMIDFDKQIRPILSDRCYHCHGPDEQARMADLRLDEQQGALQAIVPGDPAESELWSRLISEDPDSVMPPPDSKLQVTPRERKLIKAWIQQGATWKKHWAFEPRASVAPPDLNSESSVGNEIDQFILQKLQSERLQFSPLADREKLIRRVTFDLTGLPPALVEIDAFLEDDSPDAYERVVDRLMQSEHYGQRMASDWLDVARYSDTYGYQVDRDRFVWPWRDWVIRSFNKNLPYDQFMVDQIAGDLLPDATDDQILATTFGRLHPQKVEGGSVEEEFRVEYVADRTQTFATAFLGLTMECARCHDHKFDPVSQKEYYQLFSFFNNIDESGLYSFFTGSVPTPTMQLLSDEQKQNLTRLKNGVQQAAVKTPTESFDLKSPETIRQALELVGRDPIETVDFLEVGGRNTQTKDALGNPAVKLTGDDAVGLKTGNFRRYQPFSISLSLLTPDVKERAVIFHRSRAWTDAGSRGYQLLLEDGKLSASLIHFWPGNAMRVKTKAPVPVNQWVNVSVVYDGSLSAKGLAIFVDGQRAELEIVRDHLTKNITGGGGDNLAIGERFRDRGFTGGQVSQFRVYDRQLSDLEVALAQGSQSLQKEWQSLPADSKLTSQQEQAIGQHLRLNSSEDFSAYRNQLMEARKQFCAALDGAKEIMVMREMPQPRSAFVLERGLYSQPRQQVSAGTPSVLPDMDKELPRNRLGLARWLTDPEHPLTARVAVNHYWQLIFGAGIVQTPEDFGRQGVRPTHPELLDWLANDFVTNDWDLKRLLKQMVMSTAYRQSSAVSADLLERDPENKWLARAPSYRLPAEMLRDNVLSSSGLMVDKLGGAPAKPYELAASFKPSSPDSGDGLYRRSLYTYWKRTGPAPVMMALDAAKRDVCRVKRERTSSPLQALAMLNGPQFVEAARALSHRLIEQHGSDNSEDVAVDMFRILTSRRPTESELGIIQKLFLSQLEYFKADPEAAKEYLSLGKFGDYGSPAKIPMASNTHDFRLGVTPNGDEVLAGKIGRAQIFASEFNANQVRQLAEAGPEENVSIGSAAVISNQVPETFQKIEGLASAWVDDHVFFPGTSKIDFPAGFTMEAWIHPDQLGRGRIWDKVTPGTGDGVFLDLYQGLRFFVGGVQVMGNRSPQAGRWSHVVCAVNTIDGRIRMYLDGELVGSSGPDPRERSEQDLPLLAAWSSVANTLINHDECVTKR